MHHVVPVDTARAISPTDLERLLSLSGTPLAITDLDGNFHWVNEAFARAFERTSEEMLAAPLTTFLEPDSDQGLEDLFLSIPSTCVQPVGIEVSCIAASGERSPLDLQATYDPVTSMVQWTASRRRRTMVEDAYRSAPVMLCVTAVSYTHLTLPTIYSV